MAAADQHDGGHLRVRRREHSGRRGRRLPPDRDARPPPRRHHRPTSLECLTPAAAARETEPRRTTMSGPLSVIERPVTLNCLLVNCHICRIYSACI